MILVMGAAGIIGSATARAVVREWWKVILHDREAIELLVALAKELNAEYIACDITDQKATKEAVDSLMPRFAKIDGLCNIAGATNPKPFLETTDDDRLFSYKLNVLGTIHFCQAVIPYMQKNKSGRIVNIGSVRAHAQGSYAIRLAYSSSKAAIVNITAGLAKEYAKDNILINCVSPGGTESNISKWRDEVTRKHNTDVLLQRLATPEEVADMICFLLSDRSSYTTGQEFVVDGWFLIGNNIGD